MSKIWKRIYDYNAKEIERLQVLVDNIEDYDKEMSRLSNEELKDKTAEFRKRLGQGETLLEILPEAFAVVREAAYRVYGIKHYRVQLIGGIVLHLGRIAEMKTGEGKTLVATCPAYLNALTGEGIHIVTSNEYLAKRDCEEMGEIYSFLGLTSGVILHEMDKEKRREIYKNDIVYATNSELGFDYLKDNMITDKEERVQRKLNYVIVDEIDSILIDEARTPLIISGDGDDATDYFVKIDEFVKGLEKDIHYKIDEKIKVVTLTDEGIQKLENHYNIENYANIDNIKLRHHITQSLKANYIMTRDIDYVENKDGEIKIVDTFTGRVMDGRRFSDGLHQAIEAKEDVDIQPENKSLATITLQNYFRMYKKLSGMSGTVVTEEEEFQEIYELDVVVIPTHREIKRIDKEDRVFTNIKDKYYAIIDEIICTHKKGQPVLVGTASIQKSEDISALLKRRNIPHYVLNAKNHMKEAEIIAKAGEIGAITIATNMAGRGTDIKLSDKVKEMGGLKIIGTEKHDSRRVDNQLRGRAGRQGDPGESIFFVSLEDDMIKNFIPEKFKKVLKKLESENGEITNSSARKGVENAQKAVESDSYNARKDVIGYDDALNKQREVIYEQRNFVINCENLRDEIIRIIENVIKNTIENIDFDNYSNIDSKLDKYIDLYKEGDDIDLLIEKVIKNIELYEERHDKSEFLNECKKILLSNVDEAWMKYLSDIDVVRQGINLRSYKQVNPVQIFIIETSELFNEMTYEIKEKTTIDILEKINI